MRQLIASGRLTAAAAALTIALTQVPAGAQSDEQRAAARALATEGATAFSEGRYKDAADMFSRAESLLHAPPHLLFFARSSAKLGQYVRAREAYLKIIKEPLAANAPAAFRDAQAAAQEELKNVEPRIARLTINIDDKDARELVVKVDGNIVPSVLVGVPQPVDPGEHRVEAQATGKRAQPKAVTLKDGERQQIALRLEPDGSVVTQPTTPTGTVAPPPSQPAVGAEPSQSGVVTGPVAPPPDADSSQGGPKQPLRTLSYVAFGVGAVGVVGAAVSFVSAMSKQNEANDLFETCSTAVPSTCSSSSDPDAQKIGDLDKQAASRKTLGVVGIGVAAAGIGAGIALFLVSRPDTTTQTAQGVRVEPVVGPTWLGVRGTF